MDLILLLLSISTIIANVIIFNTPVEYIIVSEIVHYWYNYTEVKTSTYYYTLHSFYLNYSDCLSSADPTVLISISITSLVLSTLTTYTCLTSTINIYINKLRNESNLKLGNEEEHQSMISHESSIN